MTNPHRQHRRGTPEHRKSMKDIHLIIEKENRRKRVGKLKAKMKLAVKLISDEQIRSLREKLGPNDNFPDDGMKRSPEDSRRNFNIQTRAIARDKLDSLTSLTRRSNPKTPLLKQVPFGKERRPKKNSIGQSLQDEDRQDEFLALDFTNELNPISTPPKPRQQDRTRIIQARLGKMKQKLAVDFAGNSRGPDMDAIRAFKNGQDYQGYVGRGNNKKLKFEVTDGGKTMKLHGHTIARNTKKGIEVNNAGFDTPITYATLKALGINARQSSKKRGGRAILHNTEINPVNGEKVLVPHSEVSGETVRVTKPTKQHKDPRRTITEQSSFRQNIVDKEIKEQDRKTKGELPLSTTTIQPKDQRIINKITGIKSKIPKETRGTEAHHILPVKRFEGLRNNLNNGIMQTTVEHDRLEEYNPHLLGKLKSKLAITKVAVKLRAFTNSSSFVGNMRYDQEEQSVTGILSGKHYKWCGVPESKFDAWEGAGSSGAFFNRDIKGQYDCGSGGIMSELKSRISRLKSGDNVTEGMIQLAKNQSADSIMNAFGHYRMEHPHSLGSGVYDPIEDRILDARIPLDAIRLQQLFEAGTNKIGFNSVTDTRQSPCTDVNLIRSQLKSIEQEGGIPALGFDEGSLEALDVMVGSTDDEILTILRDSQRSTGILDADLTFRIVDSPKFRRN